MVRVRKYKDGGASSNKYGVLTLDGRSYDVNSDLINQLRDYSKTLDQDVAYQFNNIINALNNGENISYNSADNSITGNVEFNITNNQNDRLSKRRSRAGRLLGNLWGGKENNSRLAINALRNFKVKEAPKNKHDWTRELVGEYTLDGDKKKYVNGANNEAIINRLRSLPLILSYSDDDIFSGYNNLSKQDYINFYNSIGEEGLNALINRIKSGDWDNADAEAVNDIGIILNEPSNKNTNSNTSTNGNNASGTSSGAATNGNGDASLKNNPYVTVDSNGRIFITDAFNEAFGTKNAIYNDIWRDALMRSGQWNPDIDWLRGYTRVGNRLYKTSDFGVEGSDLYDYARIKNGFYDLNRASNFNAANDIFEYLWGNSADFSSWDNNSTYNPWMNQRSSNFRYRPLTGLYELPKGQQMIQYYENPDLDYLGLPQSYKYAIFDKNGKLINDNVDINSHKSIVNGERRPFNALHVINDENSPYNGMYINKFNLNGDTDRMWLFTDANDPENMIYYSKDLWDKNGLMDKNIRLPRELAAAINSNPNFWNRLLSDAILQNRFNRTLQEGVGSALGEGLRTTIGKLAGTSNTLSVNDFINLGFDENTANHLYDYFQNAYGDRNGRSRAQRRQDWLVDRYIDPNETIESHQDGGIIGTTVDVNKHDKESKINDYRDTKKTAKGLHNMSTADRMQIVSIAGDVASLLAAIPTGGNPVAAGIGAGSSLAQFAADVQRDGFDLKDVGSLALNLGLDAVTLLPGFGAAGKTAKLVKNVKKVANPLRKALLGIGAFNAANAIVNIANDRGTLDDWKALSTGLFAFKGIKDEVQNIVRTKYVGPKGAPKVKTESDLKKEFVDDYISKNPNVTKFNDGDVEWYNPVTKSVKDYDKALEDIKSAGVKIPEFKIKAKLLSEKAKGVAGNIVSGRWNPFGKNFKYSLKNRTLPDDVDVKNINPGRIRAYARIRELNPAFDEALRSAGIYIPSRFIPGVNSYGKWYYQAPKYNIIKNKKGGKILKGQKGINDLENLGNGLLGTVKGDDVVVTATNGYNRKPINLPDFKFKRDNALESNIINKGTTASRQLYADAHNPVETSSGNRMYGTEPNKPININKDMIYGLLDFAVANRAINKTADLQNKGIEAGIRGSLLNHFSENYPTLSLQDIQRGTNERLNNASLFKSVSSDPKVRMAEQLIQSAQADQILREGNAQISSRISDFNNYMTNLRQKYSQVRTQVANANRNSIGKGMMQLHMNEAARTQQNAQNLKNLIYQFRQDNARDILERQQATALKDQMQANNDFSAELYSIYGNRYNAENTDPNISIEQFVQNVDPRGYYELTNKYYANLPIKQYNEGTPHSWFGRKKIDYFEPLYQYKTTPTKVTFVKDGGKMYRYREVSEQHYLDQQKAINKAINDLNNNIIKLFMQMMS